MNKRVEDAGRGRGSRTRVEDGGEKLDLFALDALVVLHEMTGGVLRSVDVLAEASLRVAAHQKKKLVDRGKDKRETLFGHKLLLGTGTRAPVGSCSSARC